MAQSNAARTISSMRSASVPQPVHKRRLSPREVSEATLCGLLRETRRQQGLSQMELALRLGFSPRHISFVEVGRSRPSRTLIERWLEEVEAAPSIRSAALHHAGFAPRMVTDPETNVDGLASPVLRRLLEAHEPFPAFVFDADWNIRMANRGASWLMSVVMPDYMDQLSDRSCVDMIDCSAHPSGLLGQMSDAAEVGYGLLAQLQLELAANPGLQSRIATLEASLLDRFGELERPENPSLGHATFAFETDIGRFDLFRFQSVVDLPQDVTLQSMRVEVSLPLNEATRHAFQRHATAFDKSPTRSELADNTNLLSFPPT